MKRNVAFLIVVSAIILLAWFWLKLEPTVKPNDVILSGQLKKASLSSEPRYPSNGYVVEISLDNSTTKPLSVSERKYFSMVYTFVDGFSPFVWDFFSGKDKNENLIGSEGYSFGTDSRMIRIAAHELKAKGYLSEVSTKRINELDNRTLGYIYQGIRFPTKARIYLTPYENQLTQATKAYLVYTHYEVKWGKDLSWAKVVPIQVVRD